MILGRGRRPRKLHPGSSYTTFFSMEKLQSLDWIVKCGTLVKFDRFNLTVDQEQAKLNNFTVVNRIVQRNILCLRLLGELAEDMRVRVEFRSSSYHHICAMIQTLLACCCCDIFEVSPKLCRCRINLWNPRLASKGSMLCHFGFSPPMAGSFNFCKPKIDCNKGRTLTSATLLQRSKG